MLEWLRNIKRKRYVDGLVKRGLRLGPGVYLNDGFFLDPAHCHLISIEEGAVLGPRVTVLAHDASSLMVIGMTRVQAVRIGRRAFVGAGSILLPGSEVGDTSILGAGSVLKDRVPPGQVWAGTPARFISTLDGYRDRLSSLTAPKFAERLYAIHNLNDVRRAEMVERVGIEAPGFMFDDDAPAFAAAVDK